MTEQPGVLSRAARMTWKRPAIQRQIRKIGRIPKTLRYGLIKHEWVMIYGKEEEWEEKKKRKRGGDRDEAEQGNPTWHKLSWNCPSSWTHNAESEAAKWHVIPFTSMFFFLLWLAASPSTQTLSFNPMYLTAVSRESVSLRQSASPINLYALRCSSELPRHSQPTVLLHHLHPSHYPKHLTPLRESCQSQAYKKGLDVGHRGQPATLCSPARWRMKLACGVAPTAVGHSTEPGSAVWPPFHPHTKTKQTQRLHHPNHRHQHPWAPCQ